MTFKESCSDAPTFATKIFEANQVEGPHAYVCPRIQDQKQSSWLAFGGHSLWILECIIASRWLKSAIDILHDRDTACGTRCSIRTRYANISFCGWQGTGDKLQIAVSPARQWCQQMAFNETRNPILAQCHWFRRTNSFSLPAVTLAVA